MKFTMVLRVVALLVACAVSAHAQTGTLPVYSPAVSDVRGQIATINSMLPTLAPLANPSFSGLLNAPTVRLNFAATDANNVNNLTIIRTSTATGSTGNAGYISDAVSPNVTGNTTSWNILVQSGAMQTGNALGLHVVVQRNFGMMGNPFAFNFSAVDTSGLTSDIVGGDTGGEIDVGAGGTDVALERSALVLISREQAQALNGSYTTNAYALWIKPAAYNNPSVTGPSAFINGIACRTETAWPGSGIQSCLSSDGGNLYAADFTSANITVKTAAPAMINTNTVTYNIGGDGQNIQANDPISDPGHCIPAGGWVQAIASNKSTNVATITLSGNLSCSIASDVQLTAINAYQHGIDFNGFANMDAASIVDQLGPEFFAFNGVTIGAPAGGTCGVGCLNVQVIKQQGVPLGDGAFQNPSGGRFFDSTLTLASFSAASLLDTWQSSIYVSAHYLINVRQISGGTAGAVETTNFDVLCSNNVVDSTEYGGLYSSGGFFTSGRLATLSASCGSGVVTVTAAPVSGAITIYARRTATGT